MRNAPLWPALACCVRAVQMGLTRLRPFCWIARPDDRGLNTLLVPHAQAAAQRDGVAKKLPAAKVRPHDFRALMEILNGRKPRPVHGAGLGRGWNRPTET